MTKFYSDMTTATLYFAEDAVDVDSGSTDTSSQTWRTGTQTPPGTRASSMTSCTFAGAGFVISPTRGPGRNAHALWGASFTAFAESSRTTVAGADQHSCSARHPENGQTGRQADDGKGLRSAEGPGAEGEGNVTGFSVTTRLKKRSCVYCLTKRL